MNVPNRTLGCILLIVAAVCWSMSGVIIKLVDMSALNIAFYRSAIAALFLWPLAWKRRERFDRGSLELSVAYTGTVILLVMATKATTAANAIILQYTAPLFVFILGIPLLGEHPTRRDWGGLALAMFGVMYIFYGAGEADVVGVGYGLASGLAFGLLIVLLRRYSARDPLWVVFFNNLVVGLLLLPLVWEEIWIEGWELVLMLVMGIVQLGLPYVLFSLAVRHVSAREAALISLLEPLLNPIWVGLVVGEIPGKETQIGGVVILGGLVFRSLKRGYSKK